MTVTVRSPSSTRISVSQGGQTPASIVVKRADNLTIQSLANVDSTDLQDGYTLIYDTDTNKWVAQPLGNVTLTTVDGGTF